MEQVKNLLRQFDCNEDEVSIFSSLLNAGEQTVASIAKDTTIKRTTVYGIITRLLQKTS